MKYNILAQQDKCKHEWHVLRRTAWFSKMSEASRSGDMVAYDMAKKLYLDHDAAIKGIEEKWRTE